MFVTLQLFLGFILLIAGAELLVRGSTRLSLIVGISPLLVGLTVVAYGTSAPELAINLMAVHEVPPHSGLVIGNVVGSNISNILLILGITAIVVPLKLERRMVTTTLPFMVLISVAVYVVGLDGLISRVEGALLFAGSLGYTGVVIHRATRERRESSRRRNQERTSRRMARSALWNVVLVAAGLGVLVYGADLLVIACVEIARILEVSELVIGLSIVAVGTSLPELATSIVACLRGRQEIAVGNLMGSNIFNILLVLGLCAAISPGGIEVEEHAIDFDLVLMVAVAVACVPIFASNFRVDRWEGVLLFAYYVAYIGYLYLSSPADPTLPRVDVPLYYWLIPLVVVIALNLLRRALFPAASGGSDGEDEA